MKKMKIKFFSMDLNVIVGLLVCVFLIFSEDVIQKYIGLVGLIYLLSK